MLESRVSVFAKRALDIVASAVALVLLAPVMLVIALIVKVSEPDAQVIFKQERVGTRGKLFTMYKFRSMWQDADAHADALIAANGGQKTLFKLIDDPRITPVGRILRKYSLDEIPQFLNVFFGQMSLVGPRPALPREVRVYSARQWRRLEAKPGLTGSWQISGRSSLEHDQAMEIDLDYIDHHSFLGDIKILMKTPSVVLQAKGAA
ncbi:MAG: sugar transferase [Propionibacteriaceae bacterium]|nr:sugar transferase [Propionibacteriaceae bacterium]